MAEDSDESPRPSFADDFPRDAKLDALVAAFERGDFARVRREGPTLAAESADDAVKRAAATLVSRTKPDPVAGALIAIAALLLVVLSAWWIGHGGGK